MPFRFRKTALLLVVVVAALLSIAVSTAGATEQPVVSDPADCANYYDPYIANSIGDGRYECLPDTNNVPEPPNDPPFDPCTIVPCDPPNDPCLPTSGHAGAASACNDPCSFPFGAASAASVCPPVVNNPVGTPNPPAETGKEGEISFNDSDLGVALIRAQDANGDMVLEVYDMHNQTSNGNFMFSITHDDLAPYIGNPPAENTLLRAEGHVAVYVLDTGEIQVNVGPDSEGKIHVKIFDGIPWSHVYAYVIEPA